ncbi:hypothetical protein POTOM_048854 [Populus tomentosa]|uniref:Uncharacterized protein n=1 Tax=Populus tomentosa TaxID=118781 RepID=A0A8X7YDU8_POPTO|nr:hypothetical protein POTOM_048854 [Populus tomentosa]
MSSRAQNYEFQEWWNKQREFLDKPENTAFLTVEIHSPTVDKGHTRSARQLSWLWRLKFQQLATSLAWLTDGFIDLLRTVYRRIAASKTDSPSDSSISSRLYRIIKYFLFLVILLLCVELIAYLKGWHFSPPSVELAEAAVERAYAKWLEIRANYLAPPLQSLTNLCIILFLIQSEDRIVLIVGCFWIKFRKLRPVAAAEYVGRENVEDYPMVLVQIPMCNEREVSKYLILLQQQVINCVSFNEHLKFSIVVYQQSIAACCIQDWPKERMLIQVLDDSDELDAQLLIKAEVQKWQQRPGPDFLKKTIPHFKEGTCSGIDTANCLVEKLLSAQGIHFYFLLFQGISFLVVGLDLIGEQVS